MGSLFGYLRCCRCRRTRRLLGRRWFDCRRLRRTRSGFRGRTWLGVVVVGAAELVAAAAVVAKLVGPDVGVIAAVAAQALAKVWRRRGTLIRTIEGLISSNWSCKGLRRCYVDNRYHCIRAFLDPLILLPAMHVVTMIMTRHDYPL